MPNTPSTPDIKSKISAILKRDYENLAHLDIDRMVDLIDDWHPVNYPDGKIGTAVKVGILGWFLIREHISEL